MSGLHVTPQALDDAIRARVVELTRANDRRVRCTLLGCRALIPIGAGRRLWLDGHRRGFLCAACARLVPPYRPRTPQLVQVLYPPHDTMPF